MFSHPIIVNQPQRQSQQQVLLLLRQQRCRNCHHGHRLLPISVPFPPKRLYRIKCWMYLPIVPPKNEKLPGSLIEDPSR